MNLKKPLAATACIFIFGIAIYLCCLLMADELTYFQRGKSVEGVVVEKLKERSTRRNSGSSWHVVYEFEVDGQVIKNKDMLDMGRGFDSIKKGDAIGIVFDPQNPEMSRTHLAAPWARYPLIIVFIFAMSGVVAFVPIRVLRQG